MKPIKLIYTILTVCSPILVVSQEWKALGMQDHLPLNSNVTYGKLDNGLTYYISKDSSLTTEKVLMELAVKAGHFTEKKEQIGFSHLIEHIPFLRTPTYSDGVDSFRKFGMLPLVDVSASTNQDHTLYNFYFPQGNRKAFDEGLVWFGDIMEHLEFTDTIVNQVKSEVRGEKLYRQSNNSPSKSYDNEVYRGFLYKKEQHYEDLKQVKAKDLELYYKTRYVPENMAVFIVGNIDIQEEDIINKLKGAFDDVKREKGTNPTRVDYSTRYWDRENQFLKVDGRPVVHTPELQLFFRHFPYTRLSSKRDFQDYLTREVVYAMVDKRLKKSTRKYSPPLSVIYSKPLKYPPSYAIYHTMWSANKIKPGVQATIFTLRKIAENGFTTKELQEAVEEVRHKIVDRQGVSDQEELLDACKDHFLFNVVLPDKKDDMLTQLLDSINMEQVVQKCNELFNRDIVKDVVLVASDSVSFSLTKEEVYGWIYEAWNQPINTEVQRPEVITTLMDDDTLLSHQQFGIKEYPNLDLTELQLANGIKVVLKPFESTGREEKIKVKGFKSGGALLYNREDYFSALYAADIVKHSGVNGFNKFALARYATDREIMVLPQVKPDEVSIKAEGKEGDFNSLIQLIYLYMTRPNKNPEAFIDWKRKEILIPTNTYLDDPRIYAKDSLDRIIGDRSLLRYFEHSLKDIEGITLDKVYNFYNELFSNPEGFTFVFTGNFDPDKVIPLINRYLGAVPVFKQSFGRKTTEASSVDIPRGPKYNEVQDNNRIGSYVRLNYAGPFTFTPKEEAGIIFLGQLLQQRINNRLRYKESNSTVYHVNAGGNLYNENQAFRITITFSCDNSNVKRLIQALKAEIETIKKEGPSPKDMDDVKQFMDQYYLPIYNSNSVILRELVEMYKSPDNKRLPIKYRKNDFLKISRQHIKTLVNKYLKNDHYFEFVVKGKDKNDPEKSIQ